MKKIVLPILFASFFLFSQSCSNNWGDDKNKISETAVPSAVLSSFNSKYPGATDVEWKQAQEDGKQTYQANTNSMAKN